MGARMRGRAPYGQMCLCTPYGVIGKRIAVLGDAGRGLIPRVSNAVIRTIRILPTATVGSAVSQDGKGLLLIQRSKPAQKMFKTVCPNEVQNGPGFGKYVGCP